MLLVDINAKYLNLESSRYVGKDYSAAQELMEDELKDFYRQNSSALQMKSFRVGQLVAVPAEEEAWLRAQVVSTEHGRVKASIMDLFGKE